MPQSEEKAVCPVSELKQWQERQPDIAPAVAAIQALTLVIKNSKANTLMGLQVELKAAVDVIKSHAKSSISIAAGCELFNQYVTRTTSDMPDFKACRARLIERGERFAQASMTNRQTIANYSFRFINDDKVVLVHGFSRVVLRVLRHCFQRGTQFSVIVTESRPDNAGYRMAQELSSSNIPVSLVLDSAVAHIMHTVDLVLVGAEGIVENGGIINKIGTFQVAMVAKALRRPVYVAAESYKFARLYPLGQSDLPETKEQQKSFQPINNTELPASLEIDNPSCDFTPPEYITLLFTDLGILTPSAVSDELIKLYY